MARRWNVIQNGFARGIVDLSQQDQVPRDGTQDAAAEILNYVVERGGGLRPRPRFRRHPGLAIPIPAFSLLAGAGADGVLPVTPRVQLVPKPTSKAAARLAVLEVALRPGNPKSITFHGCRLVDRAANEDATPPVTAIESTWFSTEDGDRRMNLRVRVTRKDGTTFEPREPPANGTDENEYDWGHFVPGSVSRDIVVPIGEAGDEPSKVELIEGNGVHETFQVEVEGVSCFAETGPEGAEIDLGSPCRLIPWQVRDAPQIIALGMDFMSTADLRNPGQWRVRQNVRSFTERQLRELTWAYYGGDLLLCHRDFARPMHVKLTSEGLKVDPLMLTNMPILPAEQSVPPQIGDAGRIISITGGGVGGVPSTPSGLEGSAGALQVELRWVSSGADRYEVEYGTSAVFDANQPLTRVTRSDDTAVTETITGLTGGTQYVFRVRAVVGTSTSAWTNVVRVIPTHDTLGKPSLAVRETAFAGQTPLVPQGVQAITKQIYFEFAPASATGVEGWEFQQRDGEDAAWETTPFEDATPRTGLATHERRYLSPGDWAWRIRALGSANYPNSTWSDIVEHEYEDPRLPPPHLFIPEGVSTRYIHIAWGAVAGAMGYRLEWRQFGAEDWIALRNPGRGDPRLRSLPLPNQYVMHPFGADGYDPVNLRELHTYDLRIATYYTTSRYGEFSDPVLRLTTR